MKKVARRDRTVSIKILILISILLAQLTTVQAIPKSGGNQKKRPIVIKMATLAPNGSPWHEILKEMAVEWSKVSEGLVTLRIYPGGVAGDEADTVRKIRIGQLHAALISNGGLSRISPAVNVFVIPMAVDSWDGLDRVRNALSSRVETLLDQKGFVVLNWGDGGWVRFFVPESDPSVETVQQAKLFVWAGDDRTIEIWKTAGFNVVPLAPTDMLPGLQTGMINAYNSTAVMALASQWFPFTPVMIDMPWAPLVGATIVSKRTWEKIPESLRPVLKDIAEKTGVRLQAEIRRLEEDAIVEMQKRGLMVVQPSEEQVKHWREVMASVYPKLRGPIIPEDWFDDALRAAKGEEHRVNSR